MRVSDILKACHGDLRSGDSLKDVAGISIDTRTIKPDEIFLAIKGKKHDGYSFVHEALKKKAAGVIVSKLPSGILPDNIVILVRSTLSALKEISSFHRKGFDLPVIAVTGSNGKTTTKEMLASILSQKFLTHKSKSSFNNEIGVPLSVLGIRPEHEVCIFEVGMSYSGEIGELAGLIRPTVGIITNAGPSHLMNFPSVLEIARSKGELLAKVRERNILNADDDYFCMWKKMCRCDIITFGIKEKADFKADSIREMSSGEISFRLNKISEVKLKFPGKHNVYNALSAIACASCFKIETELVVDSLGKFTLPLQRTVIKDTGRIRVIDDTYNANPSSLRAAIEVLRGPAGELTVEGEKGRKILVAGDMLELGDKGISLHEEIGSLVARSGIDIFFSTGRLMKFAAHTARKEGMGRSFFFAEKSELIRKVLSEIRPYDTIMVKGSRATGMEEVVYEILKTA